MSLYVQWMNLIKERATVAWLTESQRVIYDQIVNQWGAARFVNLVGPVGSGKTFLAWILVKEQAYVYEHDLRAAPPNTQQVIVDDAEYTRLMRSTAQALSLGRVILITETPVKDPMPRAELRLTEHDVHQALHNLYANCSIQFTASDPKGTDLARIIRTEVIARGGLYVG